MTMPEQHHAPSTTHSDPLSIQGSEVNRSKLGHIPALDGIRGVAILLVVLSHLTPTGPNARHGLSHLIVRLSDSGTIGVDLFFVLSGFLITGILLRSKNSRRYFLNFYGRRALRIFPIYYFVLALVAIALFTMPALSSYENLRSNWPYFWFYGTNILIARYGQAAVEGRWLGLGYLWSLAVEEHFYLFWPMIVFLCSRKTLIRVCVALLVIAPLFRAFSPLMWRDSIAAYVLTWCRMDSLVIGAVLAILTQDTPAAAVVRRFRWIGLISTPLFLSYVAIRLIHPSLVHDAVSRTLENSITALFFVSLIALALVPGWTSKIMTSRTLRFFGVYSYGIYVWHGVLLNVINEALSTRRLSFGSDHLWIGVIPHYVLSIAAMTLVAMLSYHLLEQPFLKLKRYFDDGKISRKSPALDIAPAPAP
jgi:peptidoglycan/LPS O-acetylase OafA/YrhL